MWAALKCCHKHKHKITYLSSNNTETHASLSFVESDVHNFRSLGLKIIKIISKVSSSREGGNERVIQ